MSQETRLVLTGLTCPACVRRVDQKLRAVAGVDDVRIDLATGDAVISHRSAALAVPDLVAAVERAGYGATAAKETTP